LCRDMFKKKSETLLMKTERQTMEEGVFGESLGYQLCLLGVKASEVAPWQRKQEKNVWEGNNPRSCRETGEKRNTPGPTARTWGRRRVNDKDQQGGPRLPDQKQEDLVARKKTPEGLGDWGSKKKKTCTTRRVRTWKDSYKKRGRLEKGSK